jgi:hypothetical protein
MGLRLLERMSMARTHREEDLICESRSGKYPANDLAAQRTMHGHTNTYQQSIQNHQNEDQSTGAADREHRSAVFQIYNDKKAMERLGSGPLRSSVLRGWISFPVF